jgi:hypothetical protein
MPVCMYVPVWLCARVCQLVADNKIVLFMKGTQKQPRCGFSMQVVRILNTHGAPIGGRVRAPPHLLEGVAPGCSTRRSSA